MRRPLPAIDPWALKFRRQAYPRFARREASLQTDLSNSSKPLVKKCRAFSTSTRDLATTRRSSWTMETPVGSPLARAGVLVRSHEHSFWGGLLGSLLGPKLYQERDVYQALSVAQSLTATFRPVPQIGCKDVILRAFCTAVWHCSSPAQVKVTLNEPALLEA